MSRVTGARPSPALLVGIVALLAALAGTAVADQARTAKEDKLSKQEKKKVKKIARSEASEQVAEQFPVGTSQLADGAVTAPKLADGAVSGAKVANRSIGDEKLADLDLFGDSFVRATATRVGRRPRSGSGGGSEGSAVEQGAALGIREVLHLGYP